MNWYTDASVNLLKNHNFEHFPLGVEKPTNIWKFIRFSNYGKGNSYKLFCFSFFLWKNKIVFCLVQMSLFEKLFYLLGCCLLRLELLIKNFNRKFDYKFSVAMEFKKLKTLTFGMLGKYFKFVATNK